MPIATHGYPSDGKSADRMADEVLRKQATPLPAEAWERHSKEYLVSWLLVLLCCWDLVESVELDSE